MAITDWPATERPREKLAERGPEALTDAELLAIFLRTGVPGRSAVDLAAELLERFGACAPCWRRAKGSSVPRPAWVPPSTSSFRR